MTIYTHRVTIAVPEAHVAKANALALVLGENPADIGTFKDAKWQDAQGNLYALASTVVAPTWIGRATSALEVPEYAPDADMQAAQQAQALVVMGSLEEPQQASPDAITAIVGSNSESAQHQLAALGVEPVPEGEEE